MIVFFLRLVTDAMSKPFPTTAGAFEITLLTYCSRTATILYVLQFQAD